jgi:acetylglutamate kinase
MKSNKSTVAEVLIDALEYMQRFRGQTFVIKLGGEMMVDDKVLEGIAQDLILLSYVNIRPVVIHGGGVEITRAMDRLGKKPTFVKGLRVTDEETMEIVEMVLLGKTNSQIVASINKHGGNAVGLSGKSANLFLSEKKKGEVDLGLVGDIREVNTDVVSVLMEKGYIPVISPVVIAQEGTSLNINADTAAAKLAVALKAGKLITLTNVDGVWDAKKKLIERLTVTEAEELIDDGVAKEGMIPKLRAGMYAVENGVPAAHIVKGMDHRLIEEVFTSKGTGTMITKMK